jgi:predicted PurR-regulated permease PerM
VLVVLLVVVGGTSFVAYRLVDTMVRELHTLQESAPRAAADLEQSKHYGELARKMHLAERTDEFVHTIPQRLQGGSAADAFRSAATRGVAFLATGVLSLFFLLHGPRMVAGGVRQISDPVRRERVDSVAGRAYRRAWVYIAGTIGIALVAGVVAYLTAMMADVPGALPLAVWVALWDVVPLLGVPIGALPIVLLAATLGSTGKGVAVAVVLLAYNLFEVLVLQRFVEGRSLRVGPFVTIVAGLVGVELYGIGGALLAVAGTTLAAAVLSELAPSPKEQTRPPEMSDLVQHGERAHATP